MDAKELNETTTRLYERLRELSQEKLSKPISVKRKNGDEKSRGFGISNYRDLLWLPVGTLLYTYNDNLWREEGGWPTVTTGGLALECREARRNGKIVEILEIGGDTKTEEGEEK